MTQQEALATAQRRWGKTGALKRDRRVDRPGCWYTVGMVAIGLFFEVKGEGRSWAAAFADADRREKA